MTECTLPDDVVSFIRYVTLQLQIHRSTSPAQKDALFQLAYSLYVKYSIERTTNEKRRECCR